MRCASDAFATNGNCGCDLCGSSSSINLQEDQRTEQILEKQKLELERRKAALVGANDSQALQALAALGASPPMTALTRVCDARICVMWPVAQPQSPMCVIMMSLAGRESMLRKGVNHGETGV